MITFTIQAPDEVVLSGIYQNAASKFGWKAPEGATHEQIILSAIQHCFTDITAPYLSRFATEWLADRQIAAIRQKAQDDMTAAANTWLAANQPADV